MNHSPILDLPLAAIMRSEIALPLGHILQINTVGALLGAWRSPQNHKSIEKLFDTPEQARNAVAVCATWLGMNMRPTPGPVLGWWRDDERLRVDA